MVGRRWPADRLDVAERGGGRAPGVLAGRLADPDRGPGQDRPGLDRRFSEARLTGAALPAAKETRGIGSTRTPGPGSPDGKGVVSPQGKSVAYWSGGTTDAVRTIPHDGLVNKVSLVYQLSRILIAAAGWASVVGLNDGKVVHSLATPRNANLVRSAPTANGC